MLALDAWRMTNLSSCQGSCTSGPGGSRSVPKGLPCGSLDAVTLLALGKATSHDSGSQESCKPGLQKLSSQTQTCDLCIGLPDSNLQPLICQLAIATLLSSCSVRDECGAKPQWHKRPPAPLGAQTKTGGKAKTKTNTCKSLKKSQE